MRTREMKAAVKRGIKLLDEKVPNWRDRIDLEELDLSDCNSCILGQLYTFYSWGRRELSLDTTEGCNNGFAIKDIEPYLSNDDVNPDFYRQYNRLTQLWKEALS